VLLAIPFGLAIGIAVGMLGGGGSVLAVPVLVYVLGQSVSEATTASLVVVTAGAVAGGLGLLLVPAVLAAHGLAFVCLQLGFQRGGALATAGVSALLMNALPIVAGVVLFRERLPGGLLGGVRVAAFACVVVGAALLARREDRQDRSPVRVPPRQEP
jgi:uncharacterized membrane protein YfcA